MYVVVKSSSAVPSTLEGWCEDPQDTGAPLLGFFITLGVRDIWLEIPASLPAKECCSPQSLSIIGTERLLIGISCQKRKKKINIRKAVISAVNRFLNMFFTIEQ